MSSRNLWKWVCVALLLAFSLYEMYPPKAKPLEREFTRRAVNKDDAFAQIVTRFRELQSQYPNREFQNLLEAVGTNDLRRYFPEYAEAAQREREPNRYILHRLQRQCLGRFKLGLDLQGGISFVVALDTNTLFSIHTNAPDQHLDLAELQSRAMAQAVEVIRRRVDRFGVAEPVIQPAGANQILIQLPGLAEAEKESAARQIQRAAYLEFRLVHTNSANLVKMGEIPPGYEILYEERVENNKRHVIPHVVRKYPERGLTGKYLSRAAAYRDRFGNPIVHFELNGEGAKLFAQITTENVHRQLAIVLDGVIYSAPVINEPIVGGSGQISGGKMDMREAIELANVLMNPLQAPLKIVETREVDPTLGKDTIQSGIRAAIIGTVAVSAFMLVYYLVAGLIANVALLLNIIILLGIMCYFNTTYTLPGIAGIVLTIGMAVDANVLIYERIREELLSGKSLRGAIQAGYEKVLGTILDANITTLITSLILVMFGTGPVKGFGVALTIGVSVSMFTALVVTRLIFELLLDKGLLKSLHMFQFIKNPNFDFLKLAVPAFVCSCALVLFGNGYGLLVRGHKVLGPDFAGGVQQVYTFEHGQANADKLRADVRSVLTSMNLKEVAPIVQRNMSTGLETLRLVLPYEEGISEKVANALKQSLPQYKLELVSVDEVGPVIGAQIMRSAVIALLLGLFGILVYLAFRYEFSFAVGAVVALIHDVLMTAGVFFLSGRELSAPIVAAFLTIIGFSVNDTVVIFDRIREDLKLGYPGSFRDIINKALNQTLSRTIITSGTVFLSTLALYLFGGGAINDFAFTFLVGIITGTYSSIYIASALVLWWHKGQKPALGAGAEPAQTATAAANVKP